MKRDATGPALSAIFVDYDNIYLSLKRKNEDAAKRFSKDAGLWIKELESGRLITTTNGYGEPGLRRIVMNRCYGNPMPRRNSHDNSTDMNSFPFVRHHFLRAGSEVIDCPPLTAQMKNSADIRMVMDIRDMLTHDTYFDEFIILSGDADFTPLLHRLRAHARRTIIFSNDHTASPYTAISDGEVRESTLLQLLLEGKISSADPAIATAGEPPQLGRTPLDLSALRREIVTEIASLVRSAGQPVPLEALADRAVRQLGHEKTAGSGWGGSGSFRDLLSSYLPEDLRISDQAPFVVFEVARMLAVEPTKQPDAPRLEAQRLEAQRPEPQRSEAPRPELQRPELQRAEPQRLERMAPAAQRAVHVPQAPSAPIAAIAEYKTIQAPAAPLAAAPAPEPLQPIAEPARPSAPPAQILAAQPAPATPPQSARPSATQRPPASQSAAAIQQAVSRIYEACQAPPLSPPEYRALFEVMALEISTRGLTGAPTLDNIVTGAKTLGVDIRRDDVRFILEVVSETDPWFEQGASANLFANRFRNFVIARCRTHGLTLSIDELDLIEHWFAGTTAQAAPQALPQLQKLEPQAAPAQPPRPVATQTGPAPAPATDRWWSTEPSGSHEPLGEPIPGEEFPRIIRSRMRG